MSYSDHKKKDFCLPKSIPQTPQIAGFFLSPAYRIFIMKKMKDVPERDRPREKIVRKGVSSLTDQELIESILGRGTRAKDVREIAKDICGLLKDQKGTIRYDDLQSVDGVGPSKAAQIMACFELGRRYCESDDGCVKVTKPQDVLPLGIVADIRYKRQEHFICITLNGAGEVLASRIITVGLLNHSLVHPREVFADAITDRAASVICVHNHPSGSLDPSPQDIAITTQLREAGLLLGIQMIDHIIVTKAGYLSMKERGLL
jgi:DNA repair protein RadC